MRIVPRKEIERRWREHRVKEIQRKREKQAAIKGMDIVFRLDDGRKLEFRGRHYGVPPVPWPLAMKLVSAQEKLDGLIQDPSKGTVAEWNKLCRSVARLFNKVTKPADGIQLRRYLWRWWPSPMRGATIPEVVQALSFFCVCLKLGAGDLPTAVQAPAGTSPSTLAASVSTSRRGATNGVTHARGSIS